MLGSYQPGFGKAWRYVRILRAPIHNSLFSTCHWEDASAQTQKSRADAFDHTGVKSYDVSLDTQTATVVTETLPFETVLKTIKKTGKKVNSGEADGETKSIDLADE